MNKKAAMEMSVGTIVTIVLLMTVLILGLTLVRNIFQSSTDNINSIDQAVKSEVNKLFAESNDRKVVIYPPSRDISIKQGDSGGFGLSIRNTDQSEGVFSYAVKAMEIGSGCSLNLAQANQLIDLGASGANINLPSGVTLENPILVKFSISDSVPLCKIRYGIDVEKDGETYLPTISLDLEIK